MERTKTSPPATAAPIRPQYVGRRQAAALLSVNVQTIDALIRAHQLPAFKLRRRILIRLRDLLALVEAGEI